MTLVNETSCLTYPELRAFTQDDLFLFVGYQRVKDETTELETLIKEYISHLIACPTCNASRRKYFWQMTDDSRGKVGYGSSGKRLKPPGPAMVCRYINKEATQAERRIVGRYLTFNKYYGYGANLLRLAKGQPELQEQIIQAWHSLIS